MFQTGKSPGTGVPASAPHRNQRVPIYRDFVVLQLGLLVFLIDQLTKFVVRETLSLGYSVPYSGFFRITHTFNTGSAFGIFQGQNTPLIFVSVVGIIVLALIYRSQAQPSNLLRLSLGLQLGGAFGNLIDRIFRDRVTDFIDIGPWPVFNLADASIVTGLIILAWIFLKPARQPAEQAVTVASGAGQFDGLGAAYSWCPICDGEMAEIPTGWRCGTCGVKERVEAAHDFPLQIARSGVDVARVNLTPPFFITPTAYKSAVHQEFIPDIPTCASDGGSAAEDGVSSAPPDEA